MELSQPEWEEGISKWTICNPLRQLFVGTFFVAFLSYDFYTGANNVYSRWTERGKFFQPEFQCRMDAVYKLQAAEFILFLIFWKAKKYRPYHPSPHRQMICFSFASYAAAARRQ